MDKQVECQQQLEINLLIDKIIDINKINHYFNLLIIVKHLWLNLIDIKNQIILYMDLHYILINQDLIYMQTLI